jgi:hypothetical protein
MATLEQVEKLRDKANVTFEEAKAALDASDGDLLDAMILLEKSGKVPPPQSSGYYSSSSANAEGEPQGEARYNEKEVWKNAMKKIGRFLLDVFEKGNSNYLDASKNGAIVLSCPVTVLVLLIAFFFWVTIPLFVISLFFGFRYRFRGEELGKETVNNAMDNAADAVRDFKDSIDRHN